MSAHGRPQSRAIVEASRPVGQSRFAELSALVAQLEQRIAVLEGHGHSYAACYGPGGEWDRTAGPVTAKPAAPGAVGVTGEAEK